MEERQRDLSRYRMEKAKDDLGVLKRIEKYIKAVLSEHD
jgi:uncharacterized protein YdeI (YjbR/CyaY-like superfamily)